MIAEIIQATVVCGVPCQNSELSVKRSLDGCFGTLTPVFLRSLEQGQSTRLRLVHITLSKIMLQYFIGAVFIVGVTLTSLRSASHIENRFKIMNHRHNIGF